MEIKVTIQTTTGKVKDSYRAFMWFLPGMPPHMNHKHVLSLERLLLPGTIFPATNERFLIRLDVVQIDVLEKLTNVVF